MDFRILCQITNHIFTVNMKNYFMFFSKLMNVFLNTNQNEVTFPQSQNFKREANKMDSYK